MAENQSNVLITRSPKSQGIGVLLTLLFGSLGLFYSSIIGGIVMLFFDALAIIFTFGFGLIFTHIVAAVWSLVAVSMYNKKLMEGKI